LAVGSWEFFYASPSAAAFCASGFAALLYQVIWQRLLVLPASAGFRSPITTEVRPPSGDPEVRRVRLQAGLPR
jgi:hypothetical protein